MPYPSHSSWFGHVSDVWRRVQSIKLFVMQSSPLPCYLIPLGPKYPPQHFILENPQPTFLPQCERPSVTPIVIKYITYNNTLRFVCCLFAGRVFSRQTFLQSLLFGINGNFLLLIYAQRIIQTKSPKLKNWQCCLKQRRTEANMFYVFLWPPLEARLSISMFCFFFTCARKVSSLIYTLLIIRRPPKQITQHPESVTRMFKIYWD
jgi:hypothetical protein